MNKLIGRINIESSGATIGVEFYNSSVEVVETSFNNDTKEVLVTINQAILDSNIVNRKMLANESNKILNISAVSQTQFIIVVQDFEGLAVDNITYSLFEIDVLDNTEYNAFELSKLAHAQSILFGSGSEKLIALAENIGFPRPRPNK